MREKTTLRIILHQTMDWMNTSRMANSFVCLILLQAMIEHFIFGMKSELTVSFLIKHDPMNSCEM